MTTRYVAIHNVLALNDVVAMHKPCLDLQVHCSNEQEKYRTAVALTKIIL